MFDFSSDANVARAEFSLICYLWKSNIGTFFISKTTDIRFVGLAQNRLESYSEWCFFRSFVLSYMHASRIKKQRYMHVCMYGNQKN